MLLAVDSCTVEPNRLGFSIVCRHRIRDYFEAQNVKVSAAINPEGLLDDDSQIGACGTGTAIEICDGETEIGTPVAMGGCTVAVGPAFGMVTPGQVLPDTRNEPA